LLHILEVVNFRNEHETLINKNYTAYLSSPRLRRVAASPEPLLNVAAVVLFLRSAILPPFSTENKQSSQCSAYYRAILFACCLTAHRHYLGY